MATKNKGNHLFPELIQQIMISVNEQFGSKGRDVIIKAVNAYGIGLGRKVRSITDSLGLEANLENFIKFNQIVAGHVTENVTENAPNTGNSNGAPGKSFEIHHCLVDEFGVEANNIELGRLLCELDHAMVKGYNPSLSTRYSSCIRLGSNSCHFISCLTN